MGFSSFVIFDYLMARSRPAIVKFSETDCSEVALLC